MAAYIPKPEDFASLCPAVHVKLTYPEAPEKSTSVLIIFHGLGDSETPFVNFAKGISLPGVLAISVRGVSVLPPSLLGLEEAEEAETAAPARHFHWGDDLMLATTTGELDPDPGFSKATDLVLGKLIREVLVDHWGWKTSDMLLFGYGQGGSLALGLASRLGAEQTVADVTDGDKNVSQAFKGVVAIGGTLPPSTIPSTTTRGKARTPLLVCHGKSSEAVDDEAMDLIRNEFDQVREVIWNKHDDSMPGSREEMLPIMQFFAGRLQSHVE